MRAAVEKHAAGGAVIMLTVYEDKTAVQVADGRGPRLIAQGTRPTRLLAASREV